MDSSSFSSHHPRHQVFLNFRGETLQNFTSHQVFLSFRGETRQNFTSHLLKALKGRGINVFFDEEKLEKGEKLSPALLKAIAASKISIVILSKDYASSKSCLRELSKIMECNLTHGQFVLAIFYKVNPSDVRHGTGSFEESFNQHLMKNPEEVEGWKAAFSQVGELKGWHIDGGNFDRSEPEYIEAIVEDVTNKLGSKSTNVCKDLVGIDHQRDHIVRLIEQENFRVIGIWGMGGIGKTTLAEAVYNKVLSYSNKFDAHHFLPNVREQSLETNGLQSLRNKLLSKLLKENIDMDTLSIGSTLIQNRLSSLRVLVVFDDVYNSDQIKQLGVEYFGLGSKIIVTSRDLQVLRNIRVDICHQVNVLSKGNSLLLFSKHAFKQDNPVADFQDLAMKFLRYAGGTPLALKVLGAALFGKSRGEWEGAWDKLEEYPEQDIFGPLKISYDGLGDLEKNIFLDIACFHVGKCRIRAYKLLQCCYKGAEFGIGNLIDKCLIGGGRFYDTCMMDDLSQWSDGDGFWRLWSTFKMHDLLQEMGRDIARQQRSRLWSPQDVCCVLKSNKGTKSIKGISINMHPIKAVHICPTAFEKMVNLELIHFYNAIFGGYEEYEERGESGNKLLLLNQNLTYLPDALRYFHWDDCPLNSFPSNFSPCKLVKLSLRYSNIEQLWNGDEDVVNLREVDVSGCKNLRKIPNLSRATKLDKLLCHACKSLVELPCMRHLTSLTVLNLNGCPLTKFPKIPTNGALEELDLGWTQIEEVPSHELSLKELKSLDMRGTKIRNIPSSILQSDVLSKLYLSDCANLTELNFNTTPIQEVAGAKNLEDLDCHGCRSLVKLSCMTHLTSLRKLNLNGCPITKFPKIPTNGALEELDLGWTQIEEVPPLHLTSLMALNLNGCPITKFPEISTNGALKKLDLGWTHIKEAPSHERSPKELKYLDMSGTKIRNIPSTILNSDVLSGIYLSDCPHLTELNFNMTPINEAHSRSMLWVVDVSNCKSLKSLLGFPSRKCLNLKAVNCPSLEFIDGYPGQDFYFITDDYASRCVGQDIDEEDVDLSCDEYTSSVGGSMVKEDANHLDKRLNAFNIDVNFHKESRFCSPRLRGPVVEEDYNDKNDRDDPARTTLAPNRILTSNDGGDHIDKRSNAISIRFRFYECDSSCVGQYIDEADVDFGSDECTSCVGGSMAEEDANHLDTRLNAFNIDFSPHEDIRFCSPRLGGPIVEEDDNVENDHDEPTTLTPKRKFSSNDEGDHPYKRLKRP